ncbi:NAD-dependent epimerase/dehydratase family protein [Streptomyces sp. NPDC102384]|uniref:NAD-dependent epimerase/dehydratase family protein n=1 Tax=Streptomyces sp. NPDC102384 TaxID=3366166 RepID=UPI0038093F29
MKVEPQRVLVTGGAGFIGASLVAAHRKAGAPVTVLDQIGWPDATRLHPFDGDEHFRYHQIKVDDPDRLTQLLEGHEVVYHLSANTENRGDRASRSADLDSTVVGTVALLEAIAKLKEQTVRSVVLTSSQLVYAPRPASERITEQNGALAPTSRFAAGKMAAEGFLSAYAHELGLTAVACRLSNIVGAGMLRGIVHDLVQRLLLDPHQITLLGDGRQTRSYLHVDDCVAALVALATVETGGYEVFNVCNTDMISAEEVASIVAEEAPHGTPTVITGRGETGWQGDVPTLAVWPERLLGHGWQPARNSGEAVRAVVSALLAARPTGL